MGRCGICKRFYAVCGVDLCDSCIKDLEYKHRKFMEEHGLGEEDMNDADSEIKELLLMNDPICSKHHF